jgi:ABC-type enterochelin transport system permease subunit
VQRTGTFASLYLIIKELTFPWFGPSKYAFVRPTIRFCVTLVRLFMFVKKTDRCGPIW